MCESVLMMCDPTFLYKRFDVSLVLYIELCIYVCKKNNSVPFILQKSITSQSRHLGIVIKSTNFA